MTPNLSFLQRLLVILHLCLAATLGFSFISAPFFLSHYQNKSEKALFSYTIEQKENLFHSLAPKIQNRLLEKREQLDEKRAATRILPKQWPLFSLWILLSFYLGIKLLRETKCAKHATLFLVLIASVAFRNENQSAENRPKVEKLNLNDIVYEKAVSHLIYGESSPSSLPSVLLYWSVIFSVSMAALTPTYKESQNCRA